MGRRQYIGARYVPKIFDWDGSSEWRSGVQYEVLTIVTRNGSSYTSKIPVPSNIGAPESNPTYWSATGFKGDTGNGIESIEKTGSSGGVDAYTITMTDGTTTTFTVTNGEDIGAREEISELKNALSLLAYGDKQTFSASGNHSVTIWLYASRKYKITTEKSDFILFTSSDSAIATLERDKITFLELNADTKISRIYTNISNGVITIEDVSAKWEQEPFVSPEDFGAWGDGEHDDTTALTNAIDYINANVCPLVLKGQYKITADLPKLVAGVSIIGNIESTGSNTTCALLDYRTTQSYLLEQTDDATSDDKNGGVIANFRISNYGNANNKAIYLKRRGWTGLVKNLYINDYCTAICTEADDYLFENVELIHCGNQSEYALNIANEATYQNFINLHIEDCYHCILIGGEVHGIAFYGMHLEMVARSASEIIDDQSPIRLANYGARYANLFNSCYFTCLDKRHYLTKLTEANVPYFIKAVGNIPTIFENCVFTCGNISTALGDYKDQLLLASGTQLYFDSCKMDGLIVNGTAIDITSGCFKNNILKYYVTEQSVSNITVPHENAMVGNVLLFSNGMIYQ